MLFFSSKSNFDYDTIIHSCLFFSIVCRDNSITSYETSFSQKNSEIDLTDDLYVMKLVDNYVSAACKFHFWETSIHYL